jgi:hypothetical protein
MPWFCPACRTEIPHQETQAPYDKRTYRCDLCRLELIFDGRSGRMRVPSYDADELIVRPLFDRRGAGEIMPPEFVERRRRERRQAKNVH